MKRELIVKGKRYILGRYPSTLPTLKILTLTNPIRLMIILDQEEAIRKDMTLNTRLSYAKTIQRRGIVHTDGSVNLRMEVRSCKGMMGCQQTGNGRPRDVGPFGRKGYVLMVLGASLIIMRRCLRRLETTWRYGRWC